MFRRLVLIVILTSTLNAGCAGIDFGNQDKQGTEYIVVKSDGFSKIVLEQGEYILLLDEETHNITITKYKDVFKAGDVFNVLFSAVKFLVSIVL